MAEAGQRVQPNVGRSTVSSIIQIFRREIRSAGLPHRGGRGPLFTPQQEDAICEMVIANNAIRLREIQSAIIDNHDIFENIVRPYNTQHLVTFIDTLYRDLIPDGEMALNDRERWKVYDRQPHTQMTLLAAMDAACEDITAEACRGWIRHSRRFVPRCIAREDIRCDVDENMWPNRQERQEV
ncbi:hypothetical protein SRHO_G00208770 [Serrasalmus rhombeus]